MEEQLISFETATLAEEKGFILSHPLYLYDKNGKILDLKKSFDLARNTYLLKYDITLAPTQSLLQKWLREVHNIHVIPIPYNISSKEIVYRNRIVYFKDNMEQNKYIGLGIFEQSLEVGLQEALKLI